MTKKCYLIGLIALSVAACSNGGGSGEPNVTTPDAAVIPGDPDASVVVPTADAAPGTADAAPNAPDASPVLGMGPGQTCNCDSDCPDAEGHEGVCVLGICMTRASTACSSAGSSAECGAGSRCWGLDGFAGGICWPDCASYSCEGACDSDGSCAPTAGMDCDHMCGAYCSQPPPEIGPGPGPGPGPTCAELPPLMCTDGPMACLEVIPFDPDTGTGYEDYPINGETAANQYRSYLRRDLVTLIKYATAKVACQTEGWMFGDDWPLGLGDMSEADGAIPGTSVGEPGHPAGTHTNGRDIDLGYYQLGQINNRLRPICEHVSGGSDQYHCVAQPDTLDPWRSALFLGALHEHPYLRVVGCDGKAGPMLVAAYSQLCEDGWIAPAACTELKLAYEETDMGYGWYYFHHHHMHVSIDNPALTRVAPTVPVGPARKGFMPRQTD